MGRKTNTATVTWISWNNYGSLLQAYALQYTLKSLGYDNHIISDERIVYPHKFNQVDSLISPLQKSRRLLGYWKRFYYIRVFEMIIRHFFLDKFYNKNITKHNIIL